MAEIQRRKAQRRSAKCIAGVAVLIYFIASQFAPLFYGVEIEGDIDLVASSPSLLHLFGCDSMGRDLLLRVFDASRVTLTLGLATATISLLFGVIYGFVSAGAGARLARLLSSLLEVAMSIPQLILISLIVLFFYRHTQSKLGLFLGLAIAMAVGSWMLIAKITFSLVLREKSLPYIEAARAVGASPFRIAFRHILPNIWGELLTAAGLQIPGFLLFESMLSFVGVGLQPPTSSWGLLIQEGWKTLAHYPHLVLAPAAVLFILVFLINFSLSTSSEISS